MSTPTIIDFILRGKMDGEDITPRTIGLSQFNEFNRQVELFIAGSDRSKLNQVHIQIEDGSYILRTAVSSAPTMTSLISDLKLLERQDALGEVDPKRAEIVQRWQAHSKVDHDIAYAIHPEGKSFPPLRISHKTDYRIGEVQPWVTVEKYLHGEIMDMGGAETVNIHLRLTRSRKTVIIGASQDYLREQEENRLYRKALLHVQADQHYRTRELRNIRLIAFADYDPTYSEDALDRFAVEGAKAWADVPDAVGWVRELRGE